MLFPVWPILVLSYLADGRTINQRDDGGPENVVPFNNTAKCVYHIVLYRLGSY